MRHYKWSEVFGFLDKIQEDNGGTIFDERCNKTWDVGQAVCAACWGVDWNESEELKNCDSLPDTEPPPEDYYAMAKKMASGGMPEYFKPF
jgi:hypothetical protein